MEKDKVDELYHQLRSVYLNDDITEKEAIMGITSHLTQPHSSQGDYNGLLRFLSWYGEKFLLQDVYDIMVKCELKPERIVELGAGLGWLGRGLARLYGNIPLMSVDKRQWVLIDVVADIESTNGRARVVDELKPKDVVVMSELIHCLDNPAETLYPFCAWPVVAVEYYPSMDAPTHAQAIKTAEYRSSYNMQISRFHCNPVDGFSEVFPNSKCQEFHHFPHTIVVAEP